MKYTITTGKPKTKAYKYVLVIFGVVILLYAVFMGTYYVTWAPWYCTTCHESATYVPSWENSPHADVNCRYCHEQRGPLGKINSKVHGLNYVYRHVTGQYSELLGKAEIFEQNCIDCHFGGYRSFPNASRLNKQHYNFVQEGRSCLECHLETGHKKAIVPEKIFKSIKA